MNQPPRKRRRTNSPRTSEPASSPLKKRPRRPSFASPTKASLARFNPTLLGSGPRKQPGREELIKRGKQARAFIFGEESTDTPEELPRQEEEDQSTTGSQQQTPSKSYNATQRLRRSRPSIRGSDPVEDLEEEVDLPATSSTGAMLQDTPRRGVLFSSPSKRPPRRKPSPPRSTPQKLEKRTRGSENESPVEEKQAEGGAVQKKEPPDPEVVNKQREKERLLREIQELESECAQCVDKIQKFQHKPANERLDPGEGEELISFINKISGPDGLPEDEPLPPISNLLSSFLPFRAHPIAPPQPKPGQEEHIPSHRPLELDGPLPYLQMFTSLTFTPHIALPDEESHNPDTHHLHQKLTIDITGPAKLLVSTIEATIDTLSHQITDLQIPRLSLWAEAELGTSIRKKAEEEKDINCICWLMDSYWSLSKKRAEFWHKCATSFAHLVSGRTEQGTENVRLTHTNEKATTMSRKNYLRYLGRESLVLQDKHVLLKISWRVGFDWTGEAESRVGVEVAVPRVWSEADDTASLKKIPQTFDSLVEGRGVFEATRIMVGLLFIQ